MGGWKIDADGWYWRRSKAGDPKLGQRSDIGFDDSTFPGSPKEGKIYVRSADQCDAVDAGNLTQRQA